MNKRNLATAEVSAPRPRMHGMYAFYADTDEDGVGPRDPASPLELGIDYSKPPRLRTGHQ